MMKDIVSQETLNTAKSVIANTLMNVVPCWFDVDIDPSKSTFSELFSLIKREYETYKGLANYQAEKGDLEKSLKYCEIESKLFDVVRVMSCIQNGARPRRPGKIGNYTAQ